MRDCRFAVNFSMLNRKPDDTALLSTYNQTHDRTHEAYARPRFGKEGKRQTDVVKVPQARIAIHHQTCDVIS